MPEREWVEVENCDGCDFGPVLAVKCRRYVAAATEDVMLCQVCASTQAGNTALYPGNHDSREHGAVLRTIAYCTNMILAAIKAKGGPR